MTASYRSSGNPAWGQGTSSLAKESEHTLVSTVVFLPMTLRHGTRRNAIQFLTYDTDILA